jgi:cation diffusion facilitator family transporter
MSAHGSSHKAIFYAFCAIALSKLGAAAYTNSGSMLAESIHSFADCGNQVLLYVGLRQAQKPADENHPLGYGRVTYFWSFIVALMLFSMGGLFSIYEGWHKLHASEPLNKAWVALLVLGVSVLLELGSTIGCLREIRKLRGARSLTDWLKNTRNAELVVVLGEDIAALVGLVLAFIFVALAAYTGNTIYDAIGSIAIGVVLILVSFFIANRIRGLIVGRSAEEELQQAIRSEIATDPDIEELYRALTLQMGPQVMLSIKVRMRSGLSLDKAIESINALEKRIKQKFPEIAFCFVEPDTTD